MEPYEKDIEDWICDNVATVVSHDDTVLVGRQILMPSGGILDVLAAKPGPRKDERAWELVVIEVKRRVIDTSAVIQLLGYMGDISYTVGRHLDEVFSNAPGSASLEANVSKLSGILAAPDIDDDAWRVLMGLTAISYVEIGYSLRATPMSALPPKQLATGDHTHVVQAIEAATLTPMAIIRTPAEK